MTFQELKKNESIRTYIEKADEALNALGYTEHSFAHVCTVADTAKYILETLGFSEHDIDLAQIAAYLHDIGNLVNRVEHCQSGANMAFHLLTDFHMPPLDIATIVTAIGNHDEDTGVPVNPIAAALIIADKCDVRRTRVRNQDVTSFDIHDRVNYSTKESSLRINPERTIIHLDLTVDTRFSSVMDYFEIFLDRMILCRKAGEKLNLEFELFINGQQLM